MKKYAFKIKKEILLELFFDCICTICMSIIPVIQKKLFDNAINFNTQIILYLIFLFIILHVIAVISQYLCMIATWKGAVNFEKSIDGSFFRGTYGGAYKVKESYFKVRLLLGN